MIFLTKKEKSGSYYLTKLGEVLKNSLFSKNNKTLCESSLKILLILDSKLGEWIKVLSWPCSCLSGLGTDCASEPPFSYLKVVTILGILTS